MTQIGNDMSANTYSEVILALPGDSKKKHFETVFKLADAEMKIISMYQCMILEGSELGAKFTKNAWNLKTKYRVLPRCFGIYNFNEKEILSAEIEKICVSTSTLPIEDYYECRSFSLTIGLFYQDRIFFELYQFLKNFNIKPSEILLALHQKRMSLSKKITELYRSFDNDTKTELWDNKDNLRKSIKSKREVLEKYAKGELGVNVIFKHRAISSLELTDDLHNVIFSLVLELLYEKSKNLYQIYKPFLNELKIFGILRKRNVFDYEKRYSHTFTYDFKNLAKNNFAGFPKKLERPIQITFYSNNDQKDMIKEKIIECGSDINGIGIVF